MRKLLATAALLCGFVALQAQNEVTVAVLQHGDETTVFNGANALINAHEAAADGDLITLSAGAFAAPVITKGVAIYGNGFETSEANETALTKINGDIKIGKSGETVKDVRLEGVCVANSIRVGAAVNDAPVDNLVITRSYVGTDIVFSSNAGNVMVSETVLKGSIVGNSSIAVTNLSVLNCHLTGYVTTFQASSTVLIGNCVILGSNYDHADVMDNYSAFNYMNCILTGTGRWNYTTGVNSMLSNCILVSPDCSRGTEQDCYTVALADIFADGADANYTPERTFTLKQPEQWKGTDGKPIGINGGTGWSKIPATPVVKDLNLAVDGLKLKVTYDAKVR